MGDKQTVLMTQFYMQLMQLVCFLISNSFRPNWSYAVYFLTILIMLVIVPVLSVGYWIQAV